MTRNQLRDYVYHVRRREFQDWETAIRSPPLSQVSSADQRLFLRFMADVHIEATGELSRMIGWGHPQLLFLTKCGALNMFIDCTFRCVPKGFYQLMVIMVYCPAHQLFIPVFFVLLQSKDEDVYQHAIMMFIAATGWTADATTVTVDYEQALIKTAATQFRGSKIIGCLFHWKQAIRRKLLTLKIPENIISIFIGKGGQLEVLCIIPVGEIMTKGIYYIRQKTDEGGYTEKFDIFWNYLKATWMTKYDPNAWNIQGIVSSGDTDVIVNRTNNACESFNRRLNEKIGRAHPTMQILIKVLNEISCDYANKMTTIAHSRKRKLIADLLIDWKLM